MTYTAHTPKDTAQKPVHTPELVRAESLRRAMLARLVEHPQYSGA